MYKLAPSILAADFSKLGEEMREIAEAGADYVHIDVMDGMFVPSISVGLPVITSIRKESDCFFDVHLMIEEPDRYIDEFIKAGADGITVHVEACRHLDRTLRHIKEKGILTAAALNPGTPLCTLEYVLDYLDMILLMTVNPGFGGQRFIEGSYQKIENLKEMLIKKGYPHINIQVDGGITQANIDKILHRGANIIVAGTSVFKGDKKRNIRQFKEAFHNAIGKS